MNDFVCNFFSTFRFSKKMQKAQRSCKYSCVCLNVEEVTVLVLDSKTRVLSKRFSSSFSDVELPYEVITTSQGKKTLVFLEFTFNKHAGTNNYYCTMAKVGCRARVNLNPDGTVKSF